MREVTIAESAVTVVDGTSNPDAVWYYPNPLPAAAAIRDRIAFRKGVEVG